MAMVLNPESSQAYQCLRRHPFLRPGENRQSRGSFDVYEYLEYNTNELDQARWKKSCNENHRIDYSPRTGWSSQGVWV